MKEQNMKPKKKEQGYENLDRSMSIGSIIQREVP